MSDPEATQQEGGQAEESNRISGPEANPTAKSWGWRNAIKRVSRGPLNKKEVVWR